MLVLPRFTILVYVYVVEQSVTANNRGCRLFDVVLDFWCNKKEGRLPSPRGLLFSFSVFRKDWFKRLNEIGSHPIVTTRFLELGKCLMACLSSVSLLRGRNVVAPRLRRVTHRRAGEH